LIRLERYFIGIVFANLGVVLVHTVAHLVLQIVPSPPDTAFILAVILVGPVVTLTLLRFSRVLASGLLAIVMGAAFAYGVQSHFVIPGPDRVAIVTGDPWTLVFVVTGAILAVLEVAGIIVGAKLFSRTLRNPSGPRWPRG